MYSDYFGKAIIKKVDSYTYNMGDMQICLDDFDNKKCVEGELPHNQGRFCVYKI